MVPKKLTSLQHPFVKYVVSLRKEKNLRKLEKKVLIMGIKMVEELIISKAPIQTLLIQEEMADSFPFLSKITFPEVLLVTHDILKKITGVPNPEPIAATVSTPPFSDLSNASRLLVLDGLSDPGNVGTLIRSALALGWDGVYLTENTCDPFNEKALRAAKGATFKLPLCEGTWNDFVTMSEKKPLKVLLADIIGSNIQDHKGNDSLALILSKESQGPRKEAKELFEKITIPMNNQAESLNVASAGSILLYELKR
jgi:RNA methyltransferase, TrmH family